MLAVPGSLRSPVGSFLDWSSSRTVQLSLVDVTDAHDVTTPSIVIQSLVTVPRFEWPVGAHDHGILDSLIFVTC